jgi:hypothetical protein
LTAVSASSRGGSSGLCFLPLLPAPLLQDLLQEEEETVLVLLKLVDARFAVRHCVSELLFVLALLDLLLRVVVLLACRGEGRRGEPLLDRTRCGRVGFRERRRARSCSLRHCDVLKLLRAAQDSPNEGAPV